MSGRFLLLLMVASIVVIFMLGILQMADRPKELKQFPLNSLDGIITKSGVEFDQRISSDGKGSLRISVGEPAVVKLFEIGDISVEDARLIYQMRIRAENLEGDAYLEIRCSFPNRRELLSRGRSSRITGTQDWSTQEATFYLARGMKTDGVKLNLVINGKGTVWVDDISLIKASLK